MGYILSFHASARENSVGTQLANALGIRAAELGHEVEQIDLSKGLLCCTGCGWCNTHDECTAADDLFSKLCRCDAIFFTTPIYFCGIAGQAKLLLDRLYAMMDRSFTPRHPGKKVLTVYTQGDPRTEIFRATVEQTNMVFRMCGWTLADSVVVGGIDSTAPYEIDAALLHRLYMAVENL